jgi:hypothetical protein
MSVNVERDPPAAVGSAKELVESVCKFILDDYSVAYEKTESLLDLYKKAAKTLKLNCEAVPESVKGSESAQRCTRQRQVQRVSAEGPSKPSRLRAVTRRASQRTRARPREDKAAPGFARHARLAFNATRAVLEFLLETWHERRDHEAGAALPTPTITTHAPRS